MTDEMRRLRTMGDDDHGTLRWAAAEIERLRRDLAGARAAVIAEVEASRGGYEMVMCGGCVVDDIVRRLRGEPDPAMAEGEVF